MSITVVAWHWNNTRSGSSHPEPCSPLPKQKSLPSYTAGYAEILSSDLLFHLEEFFFSSQGEKNKTKYAMLYEEDHNIKSLSRRYIFHAGFLCRMFGL